MITRNNRYAVIGSDRAAASARLLAPRPRWNAGGELCLQHDERFAGVPATPTTAQHLRQRAGDLSGMKIEKFDVLSVPGSTVWRPPA